jgi:flagellar biosynthesis/type III secretory pathway M-ring protein FliF/YscJ
MNESEFKAEVEKAQDKASSQWAKGKKAGWAIPLLVAVVIVVAFVVFGIASRGAAPL